MTQNKSEACISNIVSEFLVLKILIFKQEKVRWFHLLM